MIKHDWGTLHWMTDKVSSSANIFWLLHKLGFKPIFVKFYKNPPTPKHSSISDRPWHMEGTLSSKGGDFLFLLPFLCLKKKPKDNMLIFVEYYGFLLLFLFYMAVIFNLHVYWPFLQILINSEGDPQIEYLK